MASGILLPGQGWKMGPGRSGSMFIGFCCMLGRSRAVAEAEQQACSRSTPGAGHRGFLVGGNGGSRRFFIKKPGGKERRKFLPHMGEVQPHFRFLIFGFRFETERRLRSGWYRQSFEPSLRTRLRRAGKKCWRYQALVTVIRR